jgi:transposase InsO family protein
VGDRRFYTEEEGWCWFFGAIDHCLDELVGWHTAKIGGAAALEPPRQGVRHVFGRFAKDIARRLRIRCDWGPQYIADAWINEVKWLGMTITPSYVGEPRRNGVIERFMRTLKEQCLYLHRFQRSLDGAAGGGFAFVRTAVYVAAELLFGQRREAALHKIDPGRARRREVQVEARMPREPPIAELAELLDTLPPVKLAVTCPSGVERGKERRRPCRQ